jgi:hypothetical protein
MNDIPIAIIVNADDWQGFFYNGKLIDEAHTLGDGYGNLWFLKKMAKKYNFNISDVVEAYVTDDFEDYLYDHGCFPDKLSDVQYEITNCDDSNNY